ncbi:MAG: flagellar biosynthetic protein FliR, partial [Planctomycetaceae bacterium]
NPQPSTLNSQLSTLNSQPSTVPPFLDTPLLHALSDAALRPLFDAAMAQFHAFTLVLVRMSGLMTVGPLFGQSIVPANARVLLVLAMALLITPTLAGQTSAGFRKLDIDGDGRLTRGEVPEPLLDRYDAAFAHTGRLVDDGLAKHEFFRRLALPRTLVEYAMLAIGEFALGLVLGLGVFTVLSGFQLAGEMIDQQTGIGLGEVFNPGMDTNTSITGQFLYLLGVTAFLLIEPFGGHLLMVSALVETFQTLPAGEAFVSFGAIDLLRDLVHQSLVIAVQVAAPALAAMSLIALTTGFLGHTVPQINVLVIGFPIRALANLGVLALSLSGAARIAVDALPAAIDALREALAFV